MTQFKVGDYVRVVNKSSPHFGCRGVVTNTYRTLSNTWFDVDLEESFLCFGVFIATDLAEIQKPIKDKTFNSFEQAVYEAALEVSAAQEKFKKALDALQARR